MVLVLLAPHPKGLEHLDLQQWRGTRQEFRSVDAHVRSQGRFLGCVSLSPSLPLFPRLDPSSHLQKKGPSCPSVSLTKGGKACICYTNSKSLQAAGTPLLLLP
mgnify:CR=1 FL=1